MFRITPDITLADGDVDERFVPLGAAQSRNRVRRDSGVELRLDILSASLPEDVKTRLLARHDHRVTSDGVLVVVSRASASQEENRKAARATLIGIIRETAGPSPERRPTTAPAVHRPAGKTGRSHAALSRAVKGDVS